MHNAQLTQVQGIKCKKILNIALIHVHETSGKKVKSANNYKRYSEYSDIGKLVRLMMLQSHLSLADRYERFLFQRR